MELLAPRVCGRRALASAAPAASESASESRAQSESEVTRLLRDARLCSAGGEQDDNADDIEDDDAGKVLLGQIIDDLEIFLR